MESEKSNSRMQATDGATAATASYSTKEPAKKPFIITRNSLQAQVIYILWLE
jgi:hypothetical protein